MKEEKLWKLEILNYIKELSPLIDHTERLKKNLVGGEGVALSDTHVFLLNEYFIELNTANFKILNKLLNWILSGNRKLNQLLNWILLKNENWINVWIEFVEKQKNE